ncbi:hypothetical protein CPLU01_03181 [Colletotrichum plurivorum]|uniref:Uncharacterized protein n=1 Tax=Colletotrichum plurivorum TaxID=2175906 RepID=A0A8H6NKU3_9PEZI|nr:hypothetical protein CPLU01_03181 [Colletotrichum plurivorum]
MQTAMTRPAPASHLPQLGSSEQASASLVRLVQLPRLVRRGNPAPGPDGETCPPTSHRRTSAQLAAYGDDRNAVLRSRPKEDNPPPGLARNTDSLTLPDWMEHSENEGGGGEQTGGDGAPSAKQRREHLGDSSSSSAQSCRHNIPALRRRCSDGASHLQAAPRSCGWLEWKHGVFGIRLVWSLQFVDVVAQDPPAGTAEADGLSLVNRSSPVIHLLARLFGRWRGGSVSLDGAANLDETPETNPQSM